jgi:hypothetical protein
MPKDRPTRRRDLALAESASLGEELRRWLHAREIAAGIRNRKRRKEQPTGSRGVDRVPDQYRVTKPAPQWVHQHTSPSRHMVRHTGASRGRLNQPYTNPLRDVKALRSGRLRKELRP